MDTHKGVKFLFNILLNMSVDEHRDIDVNGPNILMYGRRLVCHQPILFMTSYKNVI